MLLHSLLHAVRDVQVVALFDHRFDIDDEVRSKITSFFFSNTILDRLSAEKKLYQIADLDDVLICFGNLPPIFKVRTRPLVFLQNRYLLDKRSPELPVKMRIRLFAERYWFKLFLRRSLVIVQTSTMESQFKELFDNEVFVIPFMNQCMLPVSSVKKFDFVYVASGDAHKNHYNLLHAWEILASDGFYPSLVLTVNENIYSELYSKIDHLIASRGLNIVNVGYVHQHSVYDLYCSSKALIYPSLFESFGLPLLEAVMCGLPVMASEADYVRDVVDPIETFDPQSAISIARSVKRYMSYPSCRKSVVDPSVFIEQVFQVCRG